MHPAAQPGFFEGEGPKFFQQRSPGAVAKPSGSSHNSDVEIFLSRRWQECAVFKQNVKKFNTTCTQRIYRYKMIGSSDW